MKTPVQAQPVAKTPVQAQPVAKEDSFKQGEKSLVQPET